jgi:hypothetical protein
VFVAAAIAIAIWPAIHFTREYSSPISNLVI